MDTKRIGEFLIEKKVMNENQVNDVLKHCKKRGIRRFFGRIAIDKGYINEAIVNRAMIDMMKEEILG